MKQMNKPWVEPPRFLFRKYNLLRELKKLDAKSFLDVGCGSGGMTCAVTKHMGYRSWGIDFSKKSITNAKSLKMKYGLRKYPIFEVADVKNKKLSNKADIVGCFEVLEHVSDDKTLLKELVDLSNRYVIISVPAKQRLFSASDELAGHYRRYEKKQLQDLLKSNGLQINKFISYGYPYTNIIRLAREVVSKRFKKNNKQKSMESRTKKSGNDLLNINRLFNNLQYFIKPLYYASIPFNRFDFSEGYLVICEKRT